MRGEVGAKVLLDEVFTGFSRTGFPLASHAENVVPDVVALAKGLTGGYLPLAATLTTEKIFESFSGDPQHTFFHGHSYTANPLGCKGSGSRRESSPFGLEREWAESADGRLGYG